MINNDQKSNIAILGIGLIGGSFALAMQKTNLVNQICAYDVDPNTLKYAKENNIIHEGYLEIGPWLNKVDVVLIASPARSIVPLIKDIIPFLKESALVTDVGSTKAPIVNELGHLNYFVGGHPMAGIEKSGIQHAFSSLFENRIWVITPSQSSTEESVQKLINIVSMIGARPHKADAKAHDETVAKISHIPHILAFALLKMATDTNSTDTRQLAAGSFRDATRVTESNPQMITDMLVSNKDFILSTLPALKKEIDLLENLLDDPPALTSQLSQTQQFRRQFNIVQQ